MAKTKQAANPFYALLVVVGTLFALTACAYGVMTVVKLRPAESSTQQAGGHGLINFMDKHGVTVLMAELGILAVATFAAIGTDEYWTRRSAARSAAECIEETAPSGDARI